MTTEEILNLIFLENNEVIVKVGLLITLFIYMVGMYYFSKPNDNDRLYTLFFKIFFLKIPSITILFFFPLYVGFLYRDVSASVLYGLIVGFYGIYTSIIIVLLVLWGAEFMLNLVGGTLGDYKNFKKAYKKVVRN